LQKILDRHKRGEIHDSQLQQMLPRGATTLLVEHSRCRRGVFAVVCIAALLREMPCRVREVRPARERLAFRFFSSSQLLAVLPLSRFASFALGSRLLFSRSFLLFAALAIFFVLPSLAIGFLEANAVSVAVEANSLRASAFPNDDSGKRLGHEAVVADTAAARATAVVPAP
jgi:hypothetical protein